MGDEARVGERAAYVRALAERLESGRSGLIKLAAHETGLLAAELGPEFDRCTGTMGQFADFIQRRGLLALAHDRASTRAIGPGHDILRTSVPLGTVAVFGASNFPFAYGVLGGDTVSAIAAGCPVVAKMHPAQPELSRALASIAALAARAVWGRGVTPLGLVEHTDPADLDTPRELLLSGLVHAVGFTGSARAGSSIARTCAMRPDPILAHCEMGSVNPVFVARAASAARGAEIGAQLAQSVVLRHGQQCTRPGLVFVDRSTAGGAALVRALCDEVSRAPARAMLAPWIAKAYRERIDSLRGVAGVEVLAQGLDAVAQRRKTSMRTGEAGRTARAIVLGAPGEPLTAMAGPVPSPARELLSEEVFGPAVIVVDLADRLMPGAWVRPSLTWTIYRGGAGDAKEHRTRTDDRWLERMVRLGLAQSGRVVFDGVPTGVRVCDAMVHAGPCPATSPPHATAVGTGAIARWRRPVCLQNAPAGVRASVVSRATPDASGKGKKR